MTRGTAPELTLRRAPDARAADKHASTVSAALEELARRIHPSLGACPHFKACWEQVTLVRSLLSGVDLIRKEDRDKLLSRLNELRNSLTHLQDEYWLERRATSDRVRGYLLNDLQSARLSAKGARDADGLREAEEKIQQLREKLVGRDRNSWGAQLLKEARDECWEAYRQAREALHFHCAGMQDLAHSQLRGPVARVEADAGRDNSFEVFIRIRELQRHVSEAHLSKDQREDLRSTLRSAWEKASLRADEYKKNKRDQLGSTQSMFEEIIERKRQVIRKLEATIHDLRSKEIWSEEYGERVASWISEREDRISRIEHEIRDLEVKLASVRDRLGRL